MTEQNVPAGWYPDGSGNTRWWDGIRWTDTVQPAVQPPVQAPPAPAAPVQAAPAAGTSALDVRSPLVVVALVTCALVAVGSIGPWGSVFGVSASGTEGDGVITLVMAILAAGTVFLTANAGAAKPRFKAQWITVALGALLTLIAVIDFVDIESTNMVSPAWGIWLVLLASPVLTVVAVLLALRSGRR